jgi:hypothetical protein
VNFFEVFVCTLCVEVLFGIRNRGARGYLTRICVVKEIWRFLVGENFVGFWLWVVGAEDLGRAWI